MIGLEINPNIMSWYKIIFFHVFKLYYKDGKYTKDIPWLTATGIVSVPTGFLISTLYWIFYYFFIDKEVPKLDNTFTMLGCSFMFINYLWFTHQKRYLKIYEEYRTSDKNNKVTALLSWIYIILGFASVPIVALVIRQ